MKKRAMDPPTLLSHPGYRAAFEKLLALRRELGSTESEVARLETIFASMRTQVAQGGLDREAAALLTGGPDREAAATGEALQQARHKRDVLARALRMQEEILGRELTAASRHVCAAVELEYREAVAELGRALVALGRASLREREVYESVIRSGANWVLPTLCFLRAGDPRETESPITYWFREAATLGYLGRDEIPAEWLARWGCYIDSALRKAHEKDAPAARPVAPIAPPVQDGVTVPYTN